MKSRQGIVIGIGAIAILALHLSGKTGFAYPRTPAGDCIAAYIAAFNAGSEPGMMHFFKERISADSLRQVPVEERLSRYRAFKKEVGKLWPEKVIEESSERVSLLVRGEKGNWLEMIFVFDKSIPGKLMGIRIDEVDESDLADISGPALNQEEMLAKFREFLGMMAGKDEFSGVVLFGLRGEVLFHQAYGSASIEYKVANRLDTRFNLGSINKVFTRIAIEQLLEKGKLSKEDRIEKLLPDYPNREAAQKVTVAHLLEMSSGLGDFFGAKYESTPKDRIRDLADYLPLFVDDRLLFEPGSKNSYSNAGYVLLGLIVERISGQSYGDYVREHVYQPANMDAAGHLDADVPEVNVASGYTRLWDGKNNEKEPRRNNMYTRPARGSSAGGGYATTLDLFRFVLALRSGRLLGPASMGRYSGPQAYAGGAPGINAFLAIDPIPDAVLVVLSNYDPPAAMKVGNKLGVYLKRMKK